MEYIELLRDLKYARQGRAVLREKMDKEHLKANIKKDLRCDTRRAEIVLCKLLARVKQLTGA